MEAVKKAMCDIESEAVLHLGESVVCGILQVEGLCREAMANTDNR